MVLYAVVDARHSGYRSVVDNFFGGSPCVCRTIKTGTLLMHTPAIVPAVIFLPERPEIKRDYYK
ncbi:MAG: hypothetical protein ACYDC8_04630 [Gammaproteobacteria bacterium]